MNRLVNKLAPVLFAALFYLALSVFAQPNSVQAATGEVQFSIASQYQIGTAGSFGNNGNTIAKVFDSDLTTHWDSSVAQGYVGLDLLSAAKVTKIRIAPRLGYVPRLVGAIVQGANVSSSTGPWTTIYTVPSMPPYYPQRQLNEISIDTGSQYYRYYRVLTQNNFYGSVAELRMIGIASSSTPYTPVTPTITPHGGRYATSTLVTLASLTTDASLYYTTDGTTPVVTAGVPQGTTQAYTYPFLITSTATTTIKAISVLGGTNSSEVSDPAYFYIAPNFTPGNEWRNITGGQLIDAHTGGISYLNGKYYWYGESYNNSTPEVELGGIVAYSSNDLLNWKYEGFMIASSSVKYTRPRVIYNAASSTYVMWARNATIGRAMVATSSNPYGPFRVYNTRLDISGFGNNDLDLFVDDNGTGYVAHASSDTTRIVVAQLSSDYLSPQGSFVNVAALANRAAPVMFRHGDVYYLMTASTSATFAHTLAKYSTSSSPLGTYSYPVNPFQSSGLFDNTTGFASQPSEVLKVEGRTDGFVYIGDRFDNSAHATGSLYNSRFVWLPITFPTANTMSISWYSSWNLDSFFVTATPPTTVSSLAAIKNGLSVDLSWNTNGTAFDNYLERATNINFTQNLRALLLGSTTISLNDPEITNDTSYFYRVRTLTAAGSSTSNTATADFSLSADTTAPQVEITAPLQDATVLGSAVTITASSTDDVLLNSIVLQVDGVQVGSSGATSPHSVTWNTTGYADGTHTIKAIATDASSNVASTTITVNVNNSLITITPSTTTIMQGATTSITLTGNATGWSTGTPGTPTFTVTGGNGAAIQSQSVADSLSASIVLYAGSATGTLIITDPLSSATTSVTVLADVIAPAVTMTAPSAGATLVGSSVTLTATSTDNVRVTSVQFNLDGSPIGSSGTTSPYSITWNSLTTTDGAHTLTATVQDIAGNRATSTAVNVTVLNSTAPTVTTLASTTVYSFRALLAGSVTSDGGASTTARGIAYGITTTFGATSTILGTSGVGDFATTTVTGDLACGATYFYRAYATNVAGTRYGTTRSFTTSACPLADVDGEVQLYVHPAYQNGTAGSYLNSGNTYAKLYDNNVETWWDSATVSGAYASVDAKAAFIPTAIGLAPRRGYTARVYGVQLQGSNVSSTTGPWTTIHTVASTTPYTPPYFPQRHVTEVPVNSNGQAYRYLRLVAADYSSANLAEFRIIGLAGTSSPFIPVAPRVSPGGGYYRDPVRVRLSSRTTDATLYYTTDGTTPVFSGGIPQGTTQLYTGPFRVSTTSQVIAIAVSNVGGDYFVSEPSVTARISIERRFFPAADWYDMNSRLIESHDGNILYTRGKYYWYGQIMNTDSPEIEAVGVSVYSSNDLLNWTEEQPIIYGGRLHIIERPHVIYNATTSKYVMWGHNVISYPNSRAFVAYGDNPTGPFTISSTTYNPNGEGLNDMNLFKDADGKAYLLYSNGINTKFFISLLTDDYLDTTATFLNPANHNGREAPAMFIKNGIHYLVTSGLSGWAPNMNTYATSTTGVLGTWSTRVNPFVPSVEEDYTIAFRSQTTHILEIPGRAGSYIYMGDRFSYADVNNGSLYGSRHVWLPITMGTGTIMTIPWKSSWDLDTEFPTTDGPDAATNVSVNRVGNTVTVTWDNNEPTSADVYLVRATNNIFTQNVVSEYLSSTTESFVDTFDVQTGQQYYYKVQTVTGSGTTNSAVVGTGEIADTTPPVLSSIVASPATSTVTITWTTDEAANSTILYGTTVSVSSTTATTSSLLTTHSTTVTGLTPNTTYYYSIRALDAANNATTTTVATFTTSALADTTPPVISSVTATSTATTNFRVTWTTDEAANSRVEYGTTLSYGTLSSLSPSLVTSHDITIGSLATSTLYYVRVISTDASGNTATSSGTTITTLAATTTQTVVATLAAPSLSSASDTGISNSDRVTSDTTPTFTGIASTSATVYLYQGGSTLIGSASESGGTWAITSSSLADGSYAISVVQLVGSDYSATSSATTITVDTTAPTATLTADQSTIGSAGTTVTVTGINDIYGFGIHDISVTNGTVGSFATTSASVYTFNVTPVAGGAVNLVLGTTTYTDLAGNANTVSTLLNLTADLTSPIISSVVATSTSSTAALITWTTNEASDSQIEYGTTLGLGSLSTLDSSLVTSHSFTLSSLIASTTYYYRVLSLDAYANEATSSIDSFTTQIAPVEEVPVTPTTTSSRRGGSSRTYVGITPASVRAAASTLLPSITPAPSPSQGVTSNASRIFTQQLSVGSIGNEVRQLQAILFEKGMMDVPPTGFFGMKTLAGVRELQKQYGLPSVGAVGPLTRELLNTIISGNTDSTSASVPVPQNVVPQIVPQVTPTAPQQSTRFEFKNFLEFGMENSEVSELQKRLIELGVYAGPVTGYYGEKTKAAVIELQKKNGLDQRGYVGVNTRKVLNSQ